MSFQTLIAAFAAATNNEIFDTNWKGGEWMHHAVETQETIADFEASSSKWNERSAKTYRGEVEGVAYLCWPMVQPRRGDTRRPLTVLDFGDRRFAVEIDITDLV